MPAPTPPPTPALTVTTGSQTEVSCTHQDKYIEHLLAIIQRQEEELLLGDDTEEEEEEAFDAHAIMEASSDEHEVANKKFGLRLRAAEREEDAMKLEDDNSWNERARASRFSREQAAMAAQDHNIGASEDEGDDSAGDDAKDDDANDDHGDDKHVAKRPRTV